MPQEIKTAVHANTKSNLGPKMFILELLILPYISGFFIGTVNDQEFSMLRYWWLGFSQKGMILSIIFFCITAVVMHVITIFKTDSLEHDEQGRRISEVKTYGNAHFQTEEEMRENYTVAPLASSNRALYGSLDKENTIYVSERRYEPFEKPDNKNRVYFGSAGSGKTDTGLIPDAIRLADCGENMLITDTKGEMYWKLSEYLEQRGYVCYMYSSKKDWMKNADRFNPMEYLDQDINKVLSFATFILNLSEEVREDNYFRNGEVALFVCLCLLLTNPDFIKGRTEYSNISYLYRYLASAPLGRILDDLNQIQDGAPGYEGAQAFIQEKEAAQKDFKSGLQGKLQMYNSKEVADMMSFSDFEPMDFMGNKSAVFLVMDDTDPTFEPLARCFLSTFINGIINIADNFPGDDENKYKQSKIHPAFNLILEETANLGKINILNRVISTVRSRNMNTTMCFQNIQQLQTIYKGEDQSLLSACHTQIYFGVNDKLTAADIEDLLGSKSTIVDTVRRDESTISAVDMPLQQSHSYQEVKAPVMTKQQVLEETRDINIVRTMGKPPMKLWPILFLKMSEYSNVYHPRNDRMPKMRLPISKRPDKYYDYFNVPKPDFNKRKEIKEHFREMIKQIDVEEYYKDKLKEDIVQSGRIVVPHFTKEEWQPQNKTDENPENNRKHTQTTNNDDKSSDETTIITEKGEVKNAPVASPEMTGLDLQRMMNQARPVKYKIPDIDEDKAEDML